MVTYKTSRIVLCGIVILLSLVGLVIISLTPRHLPGWANLRLYAGNPGVETGWTEVMLAGGLITHQRSATSFGMGAKLRGETQLDGSTIVHAPEGWRVHLASSLAFATATCNDTHYAIADRENSYLLSKRTGHIDQLKGESVYLARDFKLTLKFGGQANLISTTQSADSELITWQPRNTVCASLTNELVALASREKLKIRARGGPVRTFEAPRGFQFKKILAMENGDCYCLLGSSWSSSSQSCVMLIQGGNRGAEVSGNFVQSWHLTMG